MADLSFITSAAGIFDRLASPIFGRAADMWDLKGNFQSPQHALLIAQTVLEDAEDQQVTNKIVRAWLSKLNAAAYQDEDLLDQMTVSIKMSGTVKKIRVCRFGADLVFPEKLRLTLQELEKSVMVGSKFHLRQGSAQLESDSRETGPFLIESEIFGRNEEKGTTVKLLLLSKEAYASLISIIGTGIGKTTLAQLAYNDEEVTQNFDVKIWVFVSGDFDVKRIVKEIIEYATMDECHSLAMDVLQSMLWALLHKKRYLIVFEAGDAYGGGISGYRMLDITHDLAQFVAGKESVVIEHSLLSGNLAKTRHGSMITDFRSPKISEDLYEAKHLPTLILLPEGNTTNDLHRLFISFPFLRVLDSYSFDLCKRYYQFAPLLCLRYLFLPYTSITTLDFKTEELPFLQTLNIYGCYNLRELPTLANILSLRHLNITRC